MAARTVSVSGNAYTYVITDQTGSNSVTVIATQNPGSGVTMTYSSSGNVQQDANQMLTQLLIEISTGLLPAAFPGG